MPKHTTPILSEHEHPYEHTPLQFQGFLWQREKDSNPHKQSQSLSCYPYTIPLFRTRYRGHE